ncbi:hypothetical protein OH77DRAFT_1425832 [Trametes cingulata]|nr:hypothetical protein OH77DRAFT_1425832 [Trametes cingulata]
MLYPRTAKRKRHPRSPVDIRTCARGDDAICPRYATRSGLIPLGLSSGGRLCQVRCQLWKKSSTSYSPELELRAVLTCDCSCAQQYDGVRRFLTDSFLTRQNARRGVNCSNDRANLHNRYPIAGLHTGPPARCHKGSSSLETTRSPLAYGWLILCRAGLCSPISWGGTVNVRCSTATFTLSLHSPPRSGCRRSFRS